MVQSDVSASQWQRRACMAGPRRTCRGHECHCGHECHRGHCCCSGASAPNRCRVAMAVRGALAAVCESVFETEISPSRLEGCIAAIALRVVEELAAGG